MDGSRSEPGSDATSESGRRGPPTEKWTRTKMVTLPPLTLNTGYSNINIYICYTSVTVIKLLNTTTEKSQETFDGESKNNK